MADITECGVVEVIGLKKCGSSQIRKSFHGKRWERGHFGNDNVLRYVSAFRNPAQRLVSCWTHLVRFRYEVPAKVDGRVNEFGPAWAFPKWCDWVLEQDPETMNSHMRPQTLELADHLQDKDGLLWLGQLERMRWLAKKELTEWLRYSIAMPPPKEKPRYDRWQDFYTREQLQRVRHRYRIDFNLWMILFANGCEVFRVSEFVRAVNLTNGRHFGKM